MRLHQIYSFEVSAKCNRSNNKSKGLIMAKFTPKTRVSSYFSLGRDQTTLDFVDVPIGNDVAVFLDPSRIRSLDNEWAATCNSLLQNFFQHLLDLIKQNERQEALLMLEGLSESNEFHLGLSRGKSNGSGIGRKFARDFWAALSKSKAGRTGLLKDIEDACLFIDGVGPDRISDAVCNILRAPLISYTQQMCKYYGIPMHKNVDSGLIWNPKTFKWEDKLTELPVTPYGVLLLVPKIAVRHRLSYDAGAYYTHYLLPKMQIHEKTINSGLVQVLKDGTKKVTKKSLRKAYGADKTVIAEQSLLHTAAFDQFRKEKRTSQPITHHQLAEIENIDAPRFDKLLADVTKLPVGREAASDYENAIEALLSALFFPSLSSPLREHEIHNGRKRIDITYVNNSGHGFFGWLSRNYPSAHIFVECKNYGKEVANPEVDQLSGRFGPSRGKVGILVCRSVQNDGLLSERCRDTALDDRGFIIHLTDIDLASLVKDYLSSNNGNEYPLLRRKFNNLVM